MTIATSGCKQINEQWAVVKAKFEAARNRLASRKPAQPTPAPAPAPGPAEPPSTMDRPAGRHGVPRQEPPVPSRPVAATDVPYNSADTGTIAPGMSEKDIYSLWGPPADVRRQGQYTYLFFPNGCEHTCGTADVVILQNGQVVDAVLRWPGHGYSGQSSSPAATPPHGPARPGGDTLTTKSPSTP
ncbi:MAG TPA: hypothetical protein VJN39_14745 [Gemmatimonadales bacterium]|nr:hypothetical protein [Gemmatimonadales bacterium]